MRPAHCIASLRLSSSALVSSYPPFCLLSETLAAKHHLPPSEATAAIPSSHGICGPFTFPAGPFGYAESSRPLRHRVPVCSTGSYAQMGMLEGGEASTDTINQAILAAMSARRVTVIY